MDQVNQRLGIVSTRILMKLKGNPSVHTKVNCNVVIFFLYSFIGVALYVYLFFQLIMPSCLYFHLDSHIYFSM
jgi:hypothetical protein